MRITSIRAKNFLGFGEEGVHLDQLEDSTIIVGPNGSGKSSLFRAIAFVAQQLKQIQGPARGPVDPAWFYQMDTSRKLFVEVGVRLSALERGAAVNSGVLGLMYEPRSVPFKHIGNLNTQAATRAIYLVNSKCQGLFEPWLKDELFFTVEATPGRMSVPHVYIRTSTPETGVVIEEDGITNCAYLRPLNDLMLESEVWDELSHRFASRFELGQPDFALPEEVAQEIASKFTPVWFLAHQEPRQEGSRRLHLEASEGRYYEPMARELVLSLGRFLGITDSDPFRVTLFRTLSLILHRSVVHLSDLRLKSFQEVDPKNGSPGPIELIDGTDFSNRLFAMKNSKHPEERRRYGDFKREFQQVAGYDVDVVLDQRYVPPQGNSKEEVYETYAKVLFSSEEVSFTTEFAAAGLSELALVLFAVSGHLESTVLLDEPAMNLHPVKQKELHARLRSLAQVARNQLIVVTHSPEFVSPADIPFTIRIAKVGEECRVQRLKGSSRSLEGLEEKLLDADPLLGRVLFASGVILVEGEGEQAAFPVWFRKLNRELDLSSAGVVFHNVHGDGNFDRYAKVLGAWEVPFMMVGDGKARERLVKLGDRGVWFLDDDLTQLFDRCYPAEFGKLKEEWHDGAKNPLVARLLAERTAPPAPVEELWKSLKPLVDSCSTAGPKSSQ